MHRNEINSSTLIQHQNISLPNNLEERNIRYDKINRKYFIISILVIFLSLINLSFYFIEKFSFIEENRTRDRQMEGS